MRPPRSTATYNIKGMSLLRVKPLSAHYNLDIPKDCKQKRLTEARILSADLTPLVGLGFLVVCGDEGVDIGFEFRR